MLIPQGRMFSQRARARASLCRLDRMLIEEPKGHPSYQARVAVIKADQPSRNSLDRSLPSLPIVLGVPSEGCGEIWVAAAAADRVLAEIDPALPIG